jgi:hypothetical protein
MALFTELAMDADPCAADDDAKASNSGRVMLWINCHFRWRMALWGRAACSRTAHLIIAHGQLLRCRTPSQPVRSQEV